MTREPVLVITTITAIVVGAIATLTGNGFISDAAAGKATDIVNSLAQLLVLIAPIIAGVIARQTVTPVDAPVLKAGTPVSTPSGGDAVVTPA